MALEVRNKAANIFTNFQATDLVEGAINAGNINTLLDVPEVPRRRYRLFLLMAQDGTSQINIELTVNGEVVESGDLERSSSTNPVGTDFMVARIMGGSTSLGHRRKVYEKIDCTSFSVRVTTGATAQPVAYAYEVEDY